jgi:type IV secretion system protein VirB10
MNGTPIAPPPLPPRPPPGRVPSVPATRLHLGRILLLVLSVGLTLAAGAGWLLWTKARPITQPVDSTVWPAWMRQAPMYQPAAPPPPQPAPAGADPNAPLLAKLTALEAELQRLRLEQEALKKRPSGTTVIQPGQQQAAKGTPPSKPSASTLFIQHEVKEPDAPKSQVPAYTLAPGATKVPCVIETAINSDVEGYFTAKVSTNIYDTATGRHLLVPQGSTILGHDQSSTLLYGNARLPTISLTLALPDGRSVDLGHAPVTDQQGIAGLTGKVDQHFWRLFGAVFVGGALQGGTQALQVGLVQGGPIGQVAGGMGATGSQVTHQRLGRALDTRPTIMVDSGQLCQVLLTKPLTLPALWQ